MADNIDVTPGTGKTVATDDVSGVQFQKVKLDVGGDGASAPLSTTDTLPATLYSGGTEIDFTAPVEVLGTGAAGTPATGVVTVQGIASGTNVPISQATASALNATVIGAGAAGTANAGVVTVQGIASMTPVQVSQATAANLNVTAAQGGAWNITNVSGTVSLPTGAATSANQASVIGPKTPNTAAANSVLIGGVFNTSAPSLGAGQQAALQLENTGQLKVSMFAAGTSMQAIAPQTMGMGTNAALYVWAAAALQNGASNAMVTGRTVTYARDTIGTGVVATGLPLWSASDFTGRKLIDRAASGDYTLVAAGGGALVTRGHRLRLTAAGTVTVKITDGVAGTVLEQFEMVAGTLISLPLSDRPYFNGSANTILNMNLSAAVQVSGVLEYVTA